MLKIIREWRKKLLICKKPPYTNTFDIKELVPKVSTQNKSSLIYSFVPNCDSSGVIKINYTNQLTILNFNLYFIRFNHEDL